MLMDIQQQLITIENSLSRAGGNQIIDFLALKDKIKRILELKQEKNVLILGHNYMAPLVFNISGETERGDSLQLSQYAAKSDKPIILFDGVRFMAETAKILNPNKKVLIADVTAGCSLADPFGAEKVRSYKNKYPGLPVVLYINSYADAKAEAEYCCTSSNGLNVVQYAAKEFGTRNVIFLPDSLMGKNLQEELVQNKINIDLIYPGKYDNDYGSCEVHEQITAEMIRTIRKTYNLTKENPETAVLVHWECRPEVLKEADFYGSTSKMIRFIAEHPELKRVYLGTECEMTANLQNEYPHIEFVRTCAVACKHMAKITVDKILETLEQESPEIIVPEEVRIKALKSIQRMLMITESSIK